MRSVFIGFSRPKSKWKLFSLLIRAYERTPFSHVYIRWQTSRGLWLAYHSAGLQVSFISQSVFAREITVVEEYEIQLEKDQFNRLTDFCIETSGNQYGLMEVIGIPIADLFGLKKNPFSEGPTKQYCAELVLRALSEIDNISLPLDADRVTLRQVHEIVTNRIGIKKVRPYVAKF